jgi:Na+-translocating ferredoxin:NAD+ oxidoreductase RnfD subunit
MTTVSLSARSPAIHHFLRFWKTPKGITLVALALFALIALPTQGVSHAAPGLLVAVAVATTLDVVATRIRRQEWEFPSGALITGVIIAFVLRPEEPLSIVAATSAIAIASKHILRTRWSNIFNPAALALVASSFLFSTGQSWWGALPDAGSFGLPILIVAGVLIADRINKLPLVLSFLGAYYALFTVASLLGQSMFDGEIFRTPDLQAALFFVLFIADDPPTCPIRYEDQITFGVIVAFVAFLVFSLWGGVYYLPAGLIAGNAWESARRQFGRRLKEIVAEY